jgi:hypothetical protein
MALPVGVEKSSLPLAFSGGGNFFQGLDKKPQTG